MVAAIDLLPALIFFGVYQWQGIIPAVLALMVSQPLSLLLIRLLGKKLSQTQWWVCIAVLTFGTITILVDNPIFIKIKPTVVYLAFGCCLTVALLIGKNPAKAVLAKAVQFTVDDSRWRMVAWQWVALSIALAASNFASAFLLSEGVWVTIKTFVFPIITMLTLVIQLLFAYRSAHSQSKSEQKKIPT